MLAGKPASWKTKSPRMPGSPSKPHRTSFSAWRPSSDPTQPCICSVLIWAICPVKPGMPDSFVAPDSGSVLCFDYGEKRIGVAVGDLSVKLATPLQTINGEANDVKFAAIEKLLH